MPSRSSTVGGDGVPEPFESVLELALGVLLRAEDGERVITGLVRGGERAVVTLATA
ncbi:hypothetical protein ACIQXA_33210 [Streptomyces massasporeus]|uniref:hypothetical protein n=1 Tax=Streptomyces massasporeus TaxID=67324 RepID=UPI00380A1418